MRQREGPGIRVFRPKDAADYERFQAERAEERARLHAAQGTTPLKPLSKATQAKLAKIKEDDWRETTRPPSWIFARRLREYRKRRGYTQRSLAERVTRMGHPLSEDALSAIERNAKGLLVEDAFALVEALDTAPLYLFTPPRGMDLRLGGSVRVPAEHVREWLVSGLTLLREDRLSAPEEIQDMLGDEAESQRELRRVERLAQTLVDARNQGGKAEIFAAFNALAAEILRQEKSREPKEGESR